MASLTPDIDQARRLVIKIGSALLVDAQGALRQDWLSGQMPLQPSSSGHA